MKIVANRPFAGRSGEHVPFGQAVDVSDEDGRYYVAQGWAKPVKSGETEKAIDPAMSRTTGLDVDGRTSAEREIDEKQIPEGEDGRARSVTERPAPNQKEAKTESKSDSKKGK